MEDKNKMYSVIIAIVVVILIVLGIYSFFRTSGTPTQTGTETQTSAPTPASENNLIIEDQFPGSSVFVTSASLTQGGFVVIHADANGVPGAIIGTKYFDPGTNPGEITLTTPTVEGKSYYGMIHADNGDKFYDAAIDTTHLKDRNGKEIMVKFKATTKIVQEKG